MTGSSSGWPAAQDAGQWIPDVERQLSELGRRTRVPKASQILGPGLGPWAVRLFDWNDEKTLYNGVFYSETGSLNSPNSAKAWIGTSWATQDGRGVQEIAEFDAGAGSPATYQRQFTTGAGTASFSAWRLTWPLPQPEAFVPALVNATAGAGAVLTGTRLKRLDGIAEVSFNWVLGTGFVVGTAAGFQLPWTLATGTRPMSMWGEMVDSSSGTYVPLFTTDGASMSFWGAAAGGSYVQYTALSGAVPFPWVAGDVMRGGIIYPTA